jgi:hypothetical protein
MLIQERKLLSMNNRKENKKMKDTVQQTIIIMEKIFEHLSEITKLLKSLDVNIDASTMFKGCIPFVDWDSLINGKINIP